MNQNGIAVQVLANGKPIREFGCEGRTLVEGRKDLPFTIKVKNDRPDRVHAIVMVDGINVVSGESELSPKSRGYVLEAYSAYEIKGWRRTLSEVASFVFQSKDGSYSKSVKGNSAQCGVVTVVAYAEKTKEKPIERVLETHHHHCDWYREYAPWYPYRPYYPSYPLVWCSNSSLSASCSTLNSSVDASMSSCSNAGTYTFTCTGGGTGQDPSLASHGGGDTTQTNAVSISANSMNLGAAWGDTAQDLVTETSFENGVVVCQMELFYTDAKGLKKLGINTKKAPAVAKTDGFPTALNGSFCRPPS